MPRPTLALVGADVFSEVGWLMSNQPRTRRIRIDLQLLDEAHPVSDRQKHHGNSRVLLDGVIHGADGDDALVGCR